jgi:hypothetical protein
MGAPVDTGIENFEEVILGLSKADRLKLIIWITESIINDIATVNTPDTPPVAE